MSDVTNSQCDIIPKRELIQEKFWFVNAGLLPSSKFEKSVLEGSTKQLDIHELYFVLYLSLEYLIHYLELFTFDPTPLLIECITNQLKFLQIFIGTQKYASKLIKYDIILKLQIIFNNLIDKKISDFIQRQLCIDHIEKFCNLFATRLSIWLRNSKLQAYLFQYGFDPHCTTCIYNSFLIPNEVKYVNPMLIFEQKFIEKIETKCHCKIILSTETTQCGFTPNYVTIEVLFDMYKGNYVGFLDMLSFIIKRLNPTVYFAKSLRTVLLESSTLYNIMTNVPIQKLKYLEKTVIAGLPVKPFLESYSISKHLFSVLSILHDTDNEIKLNNDDEDLLAGLDLNKTNDDNNEGVNTTLLDYDTCANEEEIIQVNNFSDNVDYSFKILKYFDIKYSKKIEEYQKTRLNDKQTLSMRQTEKWSQRALKKNTDNDIEHFEVIIKQSAEFSSDNLTNNINVNNKKILKPPKTNEITMENVKRSTDTTSKSWISKEAQELLMSKYNQYYNAQLIRKNIINNNATQIKLINKYLYNCGGDKLIKLYKKFNFYIYNEWNDYCKNNYQFNFKFVNIYPDTKYLLKELLKTNNYKNIFQLFDENELTKNDYDLLIAGVGVNLKLLTQINNGLIKYPGNLCNIKIKFDKIEKHTKLSIYLSQIYNDLILLYKIKNEHILFILMSHRDKLNKIIMGENRNVKETFIKLNLIEKLTVVIKNFSPTSIYYNYINILSKEFYILHYILFNQPCRFKNLSNYGLIILYHSIIPMNKLLSVEPFLKLPHDKRINIIEQRSSCIFAWRNQKYLLSNDNEFVVDIFYNYEIGNHFYCLNQLNELFNTISIQNSEKVSYENYRTLLLFPCGEFWIFSDVEPLRSIFLQNNYKSK